MSPPNASQLSFGTGNRAGEVRGRHAVGSTAWLRVRLRESGPAGAVCACATVGASAVLEPLSNPSPARDVRSGDVQAVPTRDGVNGMCDTSV